MLTSVLSGLDLTKWRKDFITEYHRDSGFTPYMGESEMDIIHVINDLKTDGYTIRVPLLGSMKGAGVSGNTLLGGAEEELNQFYQDITWDFYRNAVVFTKKELEKSAADLLKAARPRLKDWASEFIKYQIISCFHRMSGGLAYTDSDATARNLWMANNADRVLVGAALSNYSATHATALGNIDDTADKLSPGMGRLAKFIAKTANPRIRPFKTGTQGREFFVMFCHPICFKNLKENSEMQTANRDARERGVDSNPIFQDGDLINDGVIFREIPEFYISRTSTGYNTETHLVNAGAGAAVNVGVNFLCGAQAIGMVNKQAAQPTEKKEDDYGFIKGLGIEFANGFDKLRWNNNTGVAANKDVGIVTVYASAVG